MVGPATASTVFLRHEWFRAAWAWRRFDAELAMIVASKDARIAGILPLIRIASPRIRARCFELLTIPDTQVADMIVAPDLLDAVADAFARELKRRNDWDTLRLDYLPPHGAIARALVPALRRHGLRVETLPRLGNPFISLTRTWSDYYSTRTRSLKKALNLATNRLHKAGTVRAEWITPETTGDEAAFLRALDTAIDISSRSWKHVSGSALDQPGPQAFIRTLSSAAYRQGWASIWLLYVNDQPLAMEYQLIAGGNVFALRADFDAGSEGISPGSNLFGLLLERLCERGLKQYSMGPGDNAYKKRWSEGTDALQRVLVFNHTWRGRWAWLSDRRLRPGLRIVRDRLRVAGSYASAHLPVSQR